MTIEEKNETKNVSELRLYQDIVDRAHSEITWVRSAYKWLISLVGIVIVAGIYFTYQSVVQFKTDMRNEIKDVTNNLTKEFSELKIRMKSDLDKQFIDLKHQVESRIDEEFKKENINKLVQDKAKERIDKIATPLIKTELNENFMPKLVSAELKLKKIEKESNKSIKKLNLISEFSMTVILAQNDDRKSFDKLEEWSSDKSFPLSDKAANVLKSIIIDHAQPFYTTYKVPWEKKFDPATQSLADLKKLYKSAQSLVKLSLIQYIWNRQDFSKKEKMSFLVDVLKNDNSLKAVEHAGRYFKKASGLKYKPLAIDLFLKWWHNNKANIN